MKSALKLLIVVLVCLLSAAGTCIAQVTQRVYLSGRGENDTVNWEFFCSEGRNSGKWSTIGVPSNWELQGFGKYDYGFAKDAMRGKERGQYRYMFPVPASSKGKSIELVFEGVMTDAEVKVNGRLVGPVHQGAYYAFRYDVSGLLNYGGSNLLEVSVAKHSANESVNDAERRGDFWVFGGIFRPVYLDMRPIEHFSTVAIDARADGSFKANLQLSVSHPSQISARILDETGKNVGTIAAKTISSRDTIVSLQTKLIAPKRWSPEFPHRYRVVFSLNQGGRTIHTLTERVGFRTVQVKERDGIYVNGVKVKMRGVNRHSFWPSSGRTLSKKLSVLDVNLMKDMNMNVVRMSHYPPDDHFLDACDSLGLFVFDELAGWHGKYDTPTGTKLAKALIRHDVNHPSVIFWINGNEGGHNYELDSVFDYGDIQRRPVIHAWENFRGFDTQHYREYDYGIGNYDHGHSLVLPTEFLHGMWDGGHGAGLEDYWEAMWRNPMAAGGFLWDFSDEGVVRTDKNNEIDTDGNHGADGIVGPYREKEGSFFTAKEVWSPIHFEKREIATGFDGTFTIENRFSFTNTRLCSFKARLWKHIPGATTRTSDISEASFAIVSPSIQPLEKGTLRLPLAATQMLRNFQFLYISAYDPHGRELFTWSWPIAKPAEIANRMFNRAGAGAVKINETDSLFEVSANGIGVSFSKRNGAIRKVENARGVISLGNGPVIQQGVNNFGRFSTRMEGRNLVIESAFDKKNSYNTLQWTVYPSGWVRMEARYFPGAYFTDFAGVNFSYPEALIKGVEYMGSGPYRVWKNRMRGTQLGVWKKDYNNTATGEPPFVYPEFKGYHANLYWCKFFTAEQPFTVVAEQEDVFLRLYTPKVSEDPYGNVAPVFPSGDISFMQSISGIGTKTQKTETTGPMGMKSGFYDYEKEPARALELVLYFDFSGK